MKCWSIFTLGHSNQSGDTFLQLVQSVAVQVVVDVRSSPYSRRVPQFNKNAIETLITGAGMKYVYMGDILGANLPSRNFSMLPGRVIMPLIFYHIRGKTEKPLTLLYGLYSLFNRELIFSWIR